MVTVALIVHGTRKVKSCNECTGIIEEFHETRTPAYEPGKVMVSPVVSYTSNGRHYEFVRNYYSTWMKVAQEITILYDSEDPSKATIKKGLYFAPMITGILALALPAFSVCIFRVLRSNALPSAGIPAAASGQLLRDSIKGIKVAFFRHQIVKGSGFNQTSGFDGNDLIVLP